jgi:DNA-binding transcriptional LysR family regulator
MRRRLPSLNALKAFEAAARHESFTRAADELSVTQGAVSQQVGALEDELGLTLFRRERQRLAITDAGRTYLEVVRDAFDRLAMGTEHLLRRQQSGVLTITTSPKSPLPTLPAKPDVPPAASAWWWRAQPARNRAADQTAHDRGSSQMVLP